MVESLGSLAGLQGEFLGDGDAEQTAVAGKMLHKGVIQDSQRVYQSSRVLDQYFLMSEMF